MIGGSVDIQDNSALTELGGAGLDRVLGDFTVTLNRALCESQALTLSERIEVEGAVRIFANAGC